MKGEGWCKETPEHGAHAPFHCVHRKGKDLVCCWCGDLFVDDEDVEGEAHGEYYPASAPAPAPTFEIPAQHAKEVVDALRMRRNWYLVRKFAVPEELEFACRAVAAALGVEIENERTT